MIEIYTDGDCSGNPGPGGYGIIVIINNKLEHAISSQSIDTTNNREELKAIIEAYKLAKQYYNDRDVIIKSDSAYCINMIKSWIWKWATNDWKGSNKKTVENLDLVQELYQYLQGFNNIGVEKVPGHSNIVGNELADAAATQNYIKMKKILEENDINYEGFDFLEKF